MISFTLPEIRRLLISLIQACSPDPDAVWPWYRWRRRRQYQARLCHYKQRGYAFASVLPVMRWQHRTSRLVDTVGQPGLQVLRF